jgi:hypothetical protein
MSNRKRLDAFSEKINEAQTEQLISWLAHHTYKEVQELIAAPEPAGFSMQVSLSTISRFYREHQCAIAYRRRDDLGDQAAEIEKMESHDLYQRLTFHKSSTYLIQERVFQLLNETGRTVNDLQKLTKVCEALCALRKATPKRNQLLLDRCNEIEIEDQVRRMLARKFGWHPGDTFFPVEYSGPDFEYEYPTPEELEECWAEEARASAQPQSPPQQNAA